MPTEPSADSSAHHDRLVRLESVIRDWDTFTQRVIENPLFRSLTQESWDRCRSLGIRPDQIAFSFLSEEELAGKRSANALLLAEARPYLESLSLGMSDIPYLVALSDAEGWILELLGPAEKVGDRASGFAPGASWAESAIGNNGIGTALAKGEPVFVYGIEHFADAYGGWGCLGVPIRSPDGSILGALDISVPVTFAHPSRMTVALAAVQSIERSIASSLLKQAETARREEEEFRRLAFDAGDFGLWRHDMQADIIRFDDRARGHYGFDTDSATLSDVISRVHPDDLSRLSEGMKAVFDPQNGKERFATEYRVLHPDGTIRWLAVHIRVHFSGEGEGRKADYGYGTSQDITERKESEQSLKESENRFRAVLENSLDAAYGRNLLTDRYEYMSPVIERIAGFTAEEMMHMSHEDLLDRIHPEDLPSASDQVEQASRNGSGRIEYRFRSKSGEYRWFADYLTVSTDAAGRPAYRFGAVRDVTESKAGDEALRRSERSLSERLETAQRLQEISTLLIQADHVELLYERILDTAVTILHADFASFQRFYPERGEHGELKLIGHRGFTDEAVRSWECVSAVSGSACAMALRTGERVFIPDIFNSAYLKGSEGLRTYRQTGIRAVQSTPLLSRSGTLLGMISTHWKEPHEPSEREWPAFDVLARQAADLLDRMQAEERTARKNEILSGIARIFRETLTSRTEEELGRVCLAVCEEITQSGCGFIGEMNPATERIEEIAISERCRNICSIPRDAEDTYRITVNLPIRGIYSRILLEGESLYTNDPSSHSDSIGTPPGHPALASFLGVPLVENGKTVGLIGLANRPEGYGPEQLEAMEALVPAIMQALQSKRAELALIEREHQLEQSRNEAESANRAKSEFLAHMSHEIRTPISGIMGMVDLLASRIRDSEQKSYIDLVKESAESLLSIIGDILDLSRIEAGQVGVDPEDWEIRPTIDATVAPFRIAAEEKAIELAVRIGETVPRYVRTDKEKVAQILRNLVSNAVKYTSRGRIAVSVDRTVAVEKGTVRLVFRVNDTGTGIPKDKLEAIFESFVRLHATGTERNVEGTGLGLTITKRLSDLLGGTLLVESEYETGSTFTFSLDVEPVETKPVPPPVAGIAGIAPLPPLRILLAEDNRINQMFVSMLLTESGHEVTVAENGQEAIRWLKTAEDRSFDLILMDVQMPVMDGLEATKRIRKMDGFASEVPIIALTAYAMKGDEERFRAVGMNGYVTKPIDWAELVRVIRELEG